jgi:hypothetical protein
MPKAKKNLKAQKSDNNGTSIMIFSSVEPQLSVYRTVSPYWVLPVYVALIRAVWADDGGQATNILTK